MALSDLAVFTEWVQSTMNELIAYNVQLFNEATRGAMVLRTAAHSGDYSETALFGKIAGLVRRRNAYATTAVDHKSLSQLIDRSVKVAAGTPPIDIDPHWFQWIQKSPEEAGAAIGQQMAGDTLGDMVGAALLATIAALSGQATNVYDYSGVGTGTLDLVALNGGRAKLGDRGEDIACWVMYSKPLYDLYGVGLKGDKFLFTFGNVKVKEDGFGHPIICSDAPALLVPAANPQTYYTLGLVPAACIVDQNGDFMDNVQTLNGGENISRTYQAQWSYNVGVKGFAWNKTDGGHSPSDAAIAASANWPKYATSFKDLAGVLVKTK